MYFYPQKLGLIKKLDSLDKLYGLSTKRSWTHDFILNKDNLPKFTRFLNKSENWKISCLISATFYPQSG